MNIAVIGLGLIGGSMAKAISGLGCHAVWGYDICPDVTRRALDDKAIMYEACSGNVAEIDLTLVALYPGITIDYILEYVPRMKRGSVVVDLCGVKCAVLDRVAEPCAEAGVWFVGGHPMAGRELSGYAASVSELFRGASMILTPPEGTPREVMTMLRELFAAIGFGKCIVSTPERHDEIIAYTSQLAHIVSSSYVKSPAAESFDGYSAGSFRDLTRVARLNERMWSELFLLNSDFLIREIDEIVSHLAEYRQAIADKDKSKLSALLKDGSDIKKRIDSV